MSTLTSETSPPVLGSLRARLRLPLPSAVLLSRLLVLTGAVAGATLANRVADWQHGDPQHLTLKLGWLGNVLASASVRWDSIHYLAIAQHGYTTPPNAVFFPLYPLLTRALAYVTQSYVISGVCISAGAFAVSMLLLHRLTSEELGDRVADATVLLLAFSPLSLFFTAVYTESLFLALSLAAFLLARRTHFGWAGVAAAGATLTHVEGVLLIAPLAILYWQDQHGSWPARASAVRAGRAMPGAMSLLLPLLALSGFLLYLHSHGFGWLAPSTDERYYGHHFSGPLAGAAQSIRAGIDGLANMVAGVAAGSPGGLSTRQQAFLDVVDLAVLAICVAALVAAWRRLPKAYGVYAVICLVTCLSSPVSGAPLTSLDRYGLILFPLWIVAAAWLLERRLLRAALFVNATLMCIFSFEFARWVFLG